MSGDLACEMLKALHAFVVDVESSCDTETLQALYRQLDRVEQAMADAVDDAFAWDETLEAAA